MAHSRRATALGVWMLRWILVALSLVACRPPAPSRGLPDSFSSTEKMPAGVSLAGECAPTEPGLASEISQRAALLGILPPWDPERPDEMFSLAEALGAFPETACQEAAQALYVEIVLAYRSHPKALGSFALAGLVSARRREALPALVALLGQERNAGELLVQAALLLYSEEDAQTLLQTYGGPDAVALSNAYQRRRASAAPGQKPGRSPLRPR